MTQKRKGWMGEKDVRDTYVSPAGAVPWLPGNAIDPDDKLPDTAILPLTERGRMPLTKDKYIVREDPELVLWERATREFLRNLSPNHRHRVSAVMVWEWATGEKLEPKPYVTGTSVFRKINKILRFYFGKSYMTWIANKKVPNCYNVPPGWLVRSHRPMTTELWLEYTNGTLYP